MEHIQPQYITKCIRCEQIKRYHRRNPDNSRLPTKVKKIIQRRQRLCELLTALFLFIAFAFMITTLILLIPILANFQQQSLMFTIYLVICCITAAVFILAAAFSGNFYWYFDRRRSRISWFLHCGTGPLDYYWGKAFSKHNTDEIPYTVHGVPLGVLKNSYRNVQQQSNISVVNIQPGLVAAPTAPFQTIDRKTSKALFMKEANVSVGSQFQIKSDLPFDFHHNIHLGLDAVDAIQEEDELDEEEDNEYENENKIEISKTEKLQKKAGEKEEEIESEKEKVIEDNNYNMKLNRKSNKYINNEPKAKQQLPENTLTVNNTKHSYYKNNIITNKNNTSSVKPEDESQEVNLKTKSFSGNSSI